ncbi:MAG: hypothetical protein SGJ15_11340 [Bacteroidota bacterium]|nr:hypothetical protein [Bacteroidota bacterium]
MKRIILAFLFTAIGLNLSAKVTLNCYVRYKQYGTWSKYESVNVTFLSGAELGKKMEATNLYAIIYWGNTTYTVLGHVGCGTTVVTEDCLATIPYNLDGRDTNNNEWSICFRQKCNP